MSRIEDLEKRLAVDPNSKIFVQLAEEYRKAGLQEDAIATCRAGLEKHPTYFSARVALGRALLEAGALPEARAELELVLRQVPDNLLALKFLGATYQGLGLLRESLAHYQKASTLSPDDADLVERIRQVEAAVAAAQVAPLPSADPYAPPGEQSTPPTIPPAHQPASVFIERQAQEIGTSQPVSDDARSMQEEFEEQPVTSIFKRQAREILDLGRIPVPNDSSRPVPALAAAEHEEPRPGTRVSAEPPQPGLATTTLAELYASQGHLDRAVSVYRQLVASQPNKRELQARLEELELLSQAALDPGTPSREITRSSAVSGRHPGALARSDREVRALRETIRELQGWLTAIGRS